MLDQKEPVMNDIGDLKFKKDFVFTLCEAEEEKVFQRTQIESDHQTGNFRSLLVDCDQ